MTIQNVNRSVPASVREVFLSDIPFGSYYIMYCRSYSVDRQEYVCLVRYVGDDMIHEHTAVKTNNGDYVFNTIEHNGDVSDLHTLHPDYCYGNIRGQCQYVSVPSAGDLVCLCVVVIASLMVLKTVFGGIKLWFGRRS